MCANVLKEIENACNSYVQNESLLIDKIIEFEDKFEEIPLGVSIEPVRYIDLRMGIIKVSVRLKSKELWDEKFHSVFCDDLDLKLGRVVEKRIYHEDRVGVVFSYEYTYRDDVEDKGIDPVSIGGVNCYEF